MASPPDHHKTPTGGARPSRLVLIDVNGTLVGSHGVHSRVWPAIETATRLGVMVGLCTGRPGIGSTLALATRVGPNSPHVLLSGAVVSVPGRAPMLTTALAPPLVRALRELAADHEVPLEFYVGEKLVVEEPHAITLLHAKNLGVTPTVTSFNGLQSQVVAACLTVTRDQWPTLEPHCARLPHASVSTASTPWAPNTIFVNVGAADTSKGAAISWLIGRLGLTRDHVAMIGDGTNDLDAFDAVGFAIAVAGAPIEVRQAANLVVGEAEAGGVADALGHLLRRTL